VDEHEARQLLVAAEDWTRSYQWGEALEVLRPLYAARVLQGAEHGRVAYLIGLATLWGEGAPTAEPYLREAIDAGDAATREAAETLLSRSLHEEVADLAIQDGGGIRPDEAATVLSTADELLRANDWDHAQGYYTALYNAKDLPDTYRYAGALGIGRCESARGNYDTAIPYLQYVIDNDPALKGAAEAQLQETHSQQAALTMASDGGDAGEYKELRQAAITAVSGHVFDTAYRYYEAIAEGPSISAPERAWGALGMGWVEFTRGEVDQARGHLMWAERDGTAKTVAGARRALGWIEHTEAAEQILEELLGWD
jgi:tetratricopeptide (TPR) repeat protein